MKSSYVLNDAEETLTNVLSQQIAEDVDAAFLAEITGHETIYCKFLQVPKKGDMVRYKSRRYYTVLPTSRIEEIGLCIRGYDENPKTLAMVLFDDRKVAYVADRQTTYETLEVIK